MPPASSVRPAESNGDVWTLSMATACLMRSYFLSSIVPNVHCRYVASVLRLLQAPLSEVRSSGTSFFQATIATLAPQRFLFLLHYNTAIEFIYFRLLSLWLRT